MKNKLFVLATVLFVFTSCTGTQESKTEKVKLINQLLDDWHLAAANADFDGYFDLLDEQSIYIGTDASELWTKKEFINFSKPYFDKGKAWSFKAKQRNIYFQQGGEIAWFDELLDTWMGPCRASGVMELRDENWKIQHYQLSVTVPNEKIKLFLDLMNEKESEN